MKSCGDFVRGSCSWPSAVCWESHCPSVECRPAVTHLKGRCIYMFYIYITFTLVCKYRMLPGVTTRVWYHSVWLTHYLSPCGQKWGAWQFSSDHYDDVSCQLVSENILSIIRIKNVKFSAAWNSNNNNNNKILIFMHWICVYVVWTKPCRH